MQGHKEFIWILFLPNSAVVSNIFETICGPSLHQHFLASSYTSLLPFFFCSGASPGTFTEHARCLAGFGSPIWRTILSPNYSLRVLHAAIRTVLKRKCVPFLQWSSGELPWDFADCIHTPQYVKCTWENLFEVQTHCYYVAPLSFVIEWECEAPLATNMAWSVQKP